jgi:hypothetical protein
MDNIKIPSKQTRLLREIHEKLKGTFLLRHKMHQQSILAYTVSMVVELVTVKQKNCEISECDSNPHFY